MNPGAQAAHSVAIVSCEFSPKAYLNSPELQAIAFPEIDQSSWGSEIDLTASVESSEEDALFSRFRGQSKPIIVAYGFDVALAQLRSAARTTVKGMPTWNLKLLPTRTEFTDDFEMGTSSTTADEYAERRVRRLLLDEFPMAMESGAASLVSAANEAMEENLLRGIKPLVKVKG